MSINTYYTDSSVKMGAFTNWNIARKIVLSLLIILFLLQLINRILLCGSYNPNMEGMEVTYVFYVQRALDHIFYQDPTEYPYQLNQTPPLYAFVMAKLLSIFGKGPSDVYTIYLAGRILNLICNIAAVAIFFKIVRGILRCSSFISIAFSTILFLAFYAHNYAARMDSLKSLFVIAAFYFTIKHLIAPSKRWVDLIISALLLALGAFTKLDAFFFIFLFGVALFIINARRSSVVLVAAGSIAVCTGLAVMWLIFGRDFWINVIGGLQQGVSLPYFLKFFYRSVFPVLLFILTVALFFYKRHAVNKNVVFIASIVGMSFFLAVGLMLKWGSGPVYLMDFCVFAFILCAVLLDRIKAHFQVLFLVIVIVLLAFDVAANYDTSRLIYSSKIEKTYRERYKFMERAKHTIMQKANGEKPAILCTVKDLANHLYPHCIFYSYETEYPDYLVCDNTFWGSSPTPVFNYPADEICAKAEMYIMSRKCESLPFILGMTCFPKAASEKTGDILIYRKQ